MNIQPAYVTFEQAKLLKEKGFDVECKMCVEEGAERPLPFNCGNTIHKNSLHPYYSAPEQWQVVEWLRVNHDIWVYSECDVYGDGWYPKILPCSRTVWSNVKLREKIEEFTRYRNLGYKTPQEAYSAAFDYILTNLT